MTVNHNPLLRSLMPIVIAFTCFCQAVTADARPSFETGLSADIGLKAADNTPLGTRTPLILIHGWNSDSSKWSAFIHDEHPVNENYKVYLYSYDWSRHISESSAGLRDEIESGRHFPVDRNFTIIAHSMGGLVARYYLEHPEWSGHERLDRLITLGTPHHGSPLANVAWLQNYTKLQSSLELLEQAKLLQHPTLLTFAILGVHGVNLAIKGAAQELVPLNSDGGYCLGWDNYDSTMPDRVWNGSGAIPAANRFTRELNESLASHPQRDEILERYTLVGSYFSIHQSSGFNETLAGSLMASALTRDDGSDVRQFVANDGVVPLSSALFITGYNQPVHVELDGKIAPHDNTFRTHAAANYAFFPDVVHGDLTSNGDVLEYVFGQLSARPLQPSGNLTFFNPEPTYFIINSSDGYGRLDVGQDHVQIYRDAVFSGAFGLWGYIDRTGKVVIEPQFQWLGTEYEEPFHYTNRNDFFSEGLASVYTDRGIGFIDRSGRIVISPQYIMNYPFSHGMAAVRNGDQWIYINRNGTPVFDQQFDWAYPFSEGLAVIQLGEKFGYIDTTGRVAISLQFDYAEMFSEGLARVSRDGKYGFVNKGGHFVIQPDIEWAWMFAEGFAVATASQKKGFIDKAGNFAIAPKFQSASSFSEGLACVEIDFLYGYIDKTGKFVIEPRFEYALSFSEGLAPVKVNGKWGFIDKSGRFVINPRFDYAEEFVGGLAIVKLGDRFGYVDKSGQMLTIRR